MHNRSKVLIEFYKYYLSFPVPVAEQREQGRRPPASSCADLAAGARVYHGGLWWECKGGGAPSLDPIRVLWYGIIGTCQFSCESAQLPPRWNSI